MTAASDAELGAAFAQLKERLRGYLRRRVSDAALVDDLVQGVFVKALLSRQAGRRIDNLGGWLFAAARTAVADHYRAHGRPTLELDEDLPDPQPDEDLQLHAELAGCLRGFLAQLPPLYRDTLIATDLDGATMRALAQAQGVSVSAIKSRAARGRAMLKQKLLDCCHVEMSAGVVSDYHRKAPPRCDGACG